MRIRSVGQIIGCVAIAVAVAAPVRSCHGGFAFQYEPIAEPIVGATLTIETAAWTAHRTAFGAEVNFVRLVDVHGGLGMLDLSDLFFGASDFLGTPGIDQGALGTGSFTAAISPEFFPALASGGIGLWALLTDTADAMFAIDTIRLDIQTLAGPAGAISDWYGSDNDGFMLGLQDGAPLASPLPISIAINATGTGFDETIASKVVHEVPGPGAAAVVVAGLLACLGRSRRRRDTSFRRATPGCGASGAAAIGVVAGALAAASPAPAGVSLPGAILNQPYESTLPEPSGTPPFAWTLEEGVIPPGLQLNAWGTVTGRAFSLGDYQFRVRAIDEANQTSDWEFTLSVAEPDGATTSVAGSVVDAGTLLPIEGAVVTVFGRSQYTAVSASDGGFVLETPVGETLLTITHVSHVPTTVKVLAKATAESANLGAVPRVELVALAPPVVVGVAGGVFTATDELGRMFEVAVPPGAVDGPTALTITATGGLGGFSERYVASPLHLGPPGTRFAVPVTVTVPLEIPEDPGSTVRVGFLNESTGGFRRTTIDAIVGLDGLSATYQLDSFDSLFVIDKDTFKTYGEFIDKIKQLVKAGEKFVIQIFEDGTDSVAKGQPLTSIVDCCDATTPCNDSWEEERSSTTSWKVTGEISTEVKAGFKFLVEGKIGFKVGGEYGQESTRSFKSNNSYACPAMKKCKIEKRWDTETKRLKGVVYKIGVAANGTVTFTQVVEFEVKYILYVNHYKPKECPCPMPGGKRTGQADQLHLYPPGSGLVPVGATVAVVASVQEEFMGLPAEQVVFEAMTPNLHFVGGEADGPGGMAVGVTDADGLAEVSAQGDWAGPAVIRATLAGTDLSAFLFLHLTGVDNDACADAAPATDGATPFTTLGATTDGPDEPLLCTFTEYGQVGADVWFCYQAECDGIVTVDVCGADYDAKLAAYDGCACPLSSGAIACADDDVVCLAAPKVAFLAEAGRTYLLRIGGYEGDRGSGSLNIQCDVPLTGSADVNGDGAVDGLDLGLVLAAWGACAGCDADVAPAGGDGVVDGADLGAVLAAWAG